MIPLILDIETLPDMRPGARESFISAAKENFRAPSTLTKEQAARDMNMTDASMIKFTSKDAMIDLWVAAFKETKGPEVAEQEWRRTALDGGQGQVLMIGMAIEDDEPEVIHEGNERDTLACFFSKIQTACARQNNSRPQFIGHNIVNFDLKFLLHRAIVLGVKPHITFPTHPAPWSEAVFDTMLQWAGSGGRIALDDLCQLLNIPGKGDVDGSMVYDLWATGQIQTLLDYCADDVRMTRDVWRRMSFQQAQVFEDVAA